MNKETWIFVGLAAGAFGAALTCYEYNTIKERQLREKKAENDKLYFGKLQPDQVERIERKKLEVDEERIKLKQTEDELKRTVADFKNDILEELRKDSIVSMRSTFDDWASKYEDRLDKKVDRVVSRIDDLSDKYGGVKQASNTAPSINVVNAPNN